MTIDEKIRDEKLQYQVNNTSTKISCIIISKIDKHEYLRDE